MRKLYSPLFVFFLFTYSSKAQVVINEVYGGGGNAGSTFRNDFIELYNNSASAVSLTGWSIQYASSTGTSWAKTDLTGSIPANGYYLIQQAAGTGGTTNLPTPDATGTIAMAAGAGKVVLVNNNTLIASGTSCPSGAQIIDLVGFGAANCFEGTAGTPAPSATQSVQRSPIGSDNNANNTDFVAITSPTPTNSGITVAISVAAITSPAEPSTNGNFTISIASAQGTNTTIVYTISGTATSGTDYTALSGSAIITAGNTSVSVPVGIIDDLVSDPGETVVLTLGAPPAGFSNSTSTATLTISDDEPVPVSKISAIQGSGSAATAGFFQIQGIVTGVFPNLSPAGFYVQEEDADADANTSTSEAIYVVSATAVAIGDQVAVTGTVQENGSTPSFNQAVITPTSVSIISNSNPLPTVVNVSLPLTSTTALEAVEGMQVQFPQTLYVTDNNTTHRFGEVILSSGSPLNIPTQVIDPNDVPASGTTSSGNSNVPAVLALQATNDLNRIYLDDARASGTNDFPNPVSYFNPVTKTIRIGDNITGLSGIMTYSFSAYRIQPPGSLPTFTYTARPAVPTFPGADITAASFNVLNYFNGDGAGGGFPTSRGATTAAEFIRQRDKIISAISTMNADVVGLIEVENDGTGATSALQDLVTGLNAVMGAGTYSLINDGASVQPSNGDEIRCAIIYKPAKLTPDAGGLFFTSTFVYTGTTSTRPSIVQIFTTVSTGKKFAFAVNHFKSKAGTGSGTNADQNDGQGPFNNVRKQEAQNLLDLINTSISPVTTRVLAVGDFNAYQEEDPMDLLRANSYVVLAEGQPSYEFDGQLGALDHAVITPSFSSLIVGAQVWNINSTEPIGLDYEDAIISAGESSTGDFRQPYLYNADPYSSSDHDPILIGLSFPINLPVRLVSFDATKQNTFVKLTWTTSQELNAKEFLVERSTDGVRFEKVAAVNARGNSSTNVSYQANDVNPAAGNNYYRLKTIDYDTKTELSKIVKINFSKAFTISLSPNPAIGTVIITVASNSEPLLMQLLDLSGKVVKSSILRDTVNPVSITGISKGLYLVKLIGTTETYTEKLVID